MELIAMCLLLGCTSGTTKTAGLGPEDPAAQPFITRYELRVDRTVYYTDEGIPVRSKAYDNQGRLQIIMAGWTALDGGTISAVGDGYVAVFSVNEPGRYRVVGNGKGWGKGGKPTSDPDPSLTDTLEVVVAEPDSPIISLRITPSSATVPKGQSVIFEVTGIRENGSIADPQVECTATSGTVSTVESRCSFIAPQQPGEVTLRAHLPGNESVSVEASVNVTADLAPGSTDRIVFDARNGLQVAASQTEAAGLFSYVGAKFHFVSGFDGAGTNAMRADWRSWNGQCADQGGSMQGTFPAPLPKRVYVQWKQHMGRTSAGGGLGEIGRFAITNPNCGNAARKPFLMPRDVPDRGSDGRFNFFLAGPAPVHPVLYADGGPGWNAPTAYDYQAHVGETLIFTLYVEAASSYDAADGKVKMWVNGQLVAENNAIALRDMAFHRFELPATFRAPLYDQSEYFWDVVVWSPN